MDSIAKNIGSPYTSSFFARWVERVFLSAYRDVDPQVRHKMEELLGTWRTGGPQGQELYPAPLQRTIEEALFGRHLRGGGIGGNGRSVNENQHFIAGVQQQSSLASVMERSAVAEDVRRIIGLRRAQAYRDPHDQNNNAQIEALLKVCHFAQILVMAN